jgi:hypothetical protein
MSVRRKCVDLLEYFNPFAAIPPPPQDEALPASKRPRLEASTEADAEDADTFFDADTYFYAETLPASPDDAVKVAPTDAVTVVAAFLPSTGASRSRKGKWTPEEDAKLTATVAKTGKHWVSVAALVPDRTRKQCRNRWYEALHSKSDETSAPRGKWTADEDSKLEDAVENHNGKNWAAIAAVVPGRTTKQCWRRWHATLLHCKSDETTARKGFWNTDEDSKLKDAVEKHNGKDWAAIAALVPGRTAKQCWSRWHVALLHCKSDETSARKGFWTTDEDNTLIDAVEKHNGKNWEAIAALVPGRMAKQCWGRWHDALYCRSDETARVGTWASDEDAKPTSAVTEYGDGNWAAVAELVPDRKQYQCRQLDPNINIGYCPWTPEEDAKLTSAVTEYGDSNWAAVAELVPDRKLSQCHQRWAQCLDPTINTGNWTVEENAKLTDAVKQFGNNWVPVAALVPGRTNKQCRERWIKCLDPTITQTPAGKWTPEEDAKLAKAVTELGTRDWVQVAAMVPGRTNVLCRQRWRNVLHRR